MSVNQQQNLKSYWCYLKSLNFRMQENFVVIYLKFKQRGQRIFHQYYANGIANIEDPDQTAPL